MVQRKSLSSSVVAVALVLLPWLGCAKHHTFDGQPSDAGQSAGGADSTVVGGAGDSSAGAGAGEEACAQTTCNGVCTDTSQDAEHCGACDQSCTALPHLETTDGVTCTNGVCAIPPSACASGYAHCSPDPADGCETNISVPERCGACDNSCAADAPFCALGKCSLTCPKEAPTACGKSCADLMSDPMHCGDCAKACVQPQGGGKASCTAGECGTQCLDGYHQCPGTTDCSNDTDVAHCGPDCLACEAPAGGHAVCAANACGIACDGGLKQCGGACLDTASDPKNCGDCGHDCTALPHLGSTQGISCSAGKCVVPNTACAQGYAHCSAKADDGCETDITKPDNCRTCGTQCPPDNPICTANGCKNSCAASAPTLCNGNTCADLTSDAQHCGDCATKCTQPASGGSTTCEAKKCVLHCLTGYHPCGANSCASDTDASQCEASCSQCPSTLNGTPKCVTNACTIQCSSGYHSCADGTCASNSDKNHCEASCKACSSTANGDPQCSNNSCTIACNAGYHKCTATGTCAGDSDKAKCTAACTACADPANGTGACSGNICVTASCKSNFHQCPDASCAGDTDVAHCTDTCGACPQVTNAEAPTCESKTCVTVCEPGFKLCSGKCVDPSVDPTCGGPLLATGPAYACALRSGGTVWCWGAASMAAPTQVSGLSNVVQLSFGDSPDVCGVKADGSIWCWGLSPATAPTDVSQQMKFLQVVGGPSAACAVATSKNVYCLSGTWQKKGTLLATHLAAFSGTTYARASDGSIWSWATDAAPAKQSAPAGTFTQVETAQEEVVYRTTAGAVVYVGSAGDTAINGAIGVGTLTGATTFTQVTGGLRGACALASDGRVGCWGYGPYGQLGNGATDSTTDMVRFGGTGFKGLEVARGQLWTCALKSDHTVWCAGDATGFFDGVARQVGGSLTAP